MRIAISILFGFLVVQPLFSTYRPFDINHSGARVQGAGATGVSSIDSIGSLAQNPAYLADITRPSMALGLDAQTRIQSVQSQFFVAPQYVPVVAWGMPVGQNGGVGLMINSPMQRLFPDSEYILYNIEGAYAYPITRSLNVGVTAGAAVGLQAQLYYATAFSWSLSLLYHRDAFFLGLLFRPGVVLDYSPYSSGSNLTERTPDYFKLGISRSFGLVAIALDIEQVSWQSSYFKENGTNVAPRFQHGFLDGINPHLGFNFSLPYWPGLQFRTGFYTSDFYDFLGHNDRQILWTFGLGGLAGADFWGERLRIDFSLVSSFIPSFFWSEANQIEKLQVTFEFLY